MEIAIVSDTHFGFRWESERGEDPFRNAREAFRRARDADIVVLPGDIFDKKVPKQEVLGEAIDCFREFREGECTVDLAGESDVEAEFDGTPVVAIHGTHERRSKGFTNPIELLEKTGALVHLHNEAAVFEKDGERVAVHGMSGVPERYAPQVLEKYGPRPVDDAYNLFVFHQSVKNLVYTAPDQDVLTLEALPEGFDLMVDGHIHWADLSMLDAGKPLLLPGSTVATQMRKIEAEQPKGFVTVDTATGDVEFHELESPRDLHYEEVDVSGMSSAEIMDAVAEVMDALDADGRKPLVRLVLEGETDAGVTKSEIRREWEDHAILSIALRFDRGEVEGGGTPLEESSQSIAEMGQEMLRERVGGSLRVEDLFDLLADEELDAALDLVEEMDVEVDDEAEAADDDAGGDGGDDGDTDGGTDGKTLADF